MFSFPKRVVQAGIVVSSLCLGAGMYHSHAQDIQLWLHTHLSIASETLHALPQVATATAMSRQPTGFFKKDPPVYAMLLTGGPCGGKSTAVVEIADRLRSLGYQVLAVPELATLCHQSGLHYPINGSEELQIQWESTRTSSQIAVENEFRKFAVLSGQPTVILCDRGTCDARAYMTEANWEKMLRKNGWDVVHLRDERYDAVAHMVTAANGAETFYTLENNEARYESPQLARELDLRTQLAWIGHPPYKIVDNRTSFRDKLTRVANFFMRYLGEPAPHELRRKFLVKIDSDSIEQLGYRECDIETTFLKGDSLASDEKSDVVLRRRGENEAYTYIISRRVTLPDGSNVIHSRPISRPVYYDMLKQKDGAYSTVRRRRRCFVYNDQYYELDQDPQDVYFTDKDYGLLICEVETTDGDASGFIPPFCEVVDEVTGQHSLRAMASRGESARKYHDRNHHQVE